MTVSLGRIIAELAEPGEEIPPELVDLINSNIRPPSPLTAEDVYVRAMYVVSDQVNSFGGRFPADEHARLAGLMIDSPVMVGHRKDKLPVGRNFHAVTVERQSIPWVKSYFYWLRASDNAEQLRANIDGGVYKECSVAFTFHLPECSICGQDIRRCEHQPFEEYEHDGVWKKCHFNYRQIERVLETSLVYRGAMPDTAMSRLLNSGDVTSVIPAKPADENRLTQITNLDKLNRDGNYLVLPRYDGLPLTACVTNGRLLMTRLDGTPLPQSVCEHAHGFAPESPVQGILVGYRGKERCSQGQLQDHAQGRPSPVSRSVFNVFPGQGIVSLPLHESKSVFEIRTIPYRFAAGASVHRSAQEIMTREGVEIWPFHQGATGGLSYFKGGYWYRPSGLQRSSASEPSVTITTEGNIACLNITSGAARAANRTPRKFRFELVDFSLAELRSGRRFLARAAGDDRPITGNGTVLTGQLGKLDRVGDGLIFSSAGQVSGRFILRPIRFRGEDCYLFYRTSTLNAEVRAA